ncbi:hypothetical protein SteCoe_7186 [Stentor coeruleus]|uniref:Uncharacterized protein n=1 Tax=Stentor coeruleus TaxID=5963 RepID=A0A1R2CN86_9CILI|nr:hypothetical protein SteCoe_7186 [Stentor coeruleus]
MQDNKNSQLLSVKNIAKDNKKHIIEGTGLFAIIGIGILFLGCKFYSNKNYFYFIIIVPTIYMLFGIIGLWAAKNQRKAEKVHNNLFIISILCMNLTAVGIFISILTYLFSNPWKCTSPNINSCKITYGVYYLLIATLFIFYLMSIVIVVVIFVFLKSVRKCREKSIQWQKIEDMV